MALLKILSRLTFLFSAILCFQTGDAQISGIEGDWYSFHETGKNHIGIYKDRIVQFSKDSLHGSNADTIENFLILNFNRSGNSFEYALANDLQFYSLQMFEYDTTCSCLRSFLYSTTEFIETREDAIRLLKIAKAVEVPLRWYRDLGSLSKGRSFNQASLQDFIAFLDAAEKSKMIMDALRNSNVHHSIVNYNLILMNAATTALIEMGFSPVMSDAEMRILLEKYRNEPEVKARMDRLKAR